MKKGVALESHPFLFCDGCVFWDRSRFFGAFYCCFIFGPFPFFFYLLPLRFFVRPLCFFPVPLHLPCQHGHVPRPLHLPDLPHLVRHHSFLLRAPAGPASHPHASPRISAQWDRACMALQLVHQAACHLGDPRRVLGTFHRSRRDAR